MKATFDFTYQKKVFSIEVNDYNIAQEMLKEKSFYEHWLLEFIQQNFSGGTFVDIGANTGNHTIFFSAFCKCRVIAVEPLDVSYNILKTNVDKNLSGKDIRIHKVAIADKPGSGTMIINEKLSIGGTYLAPGNSVPITTLDNLLADINDVSLIKIDVEGNEMEVLKGGLSIINKFKPEIFVETWVEDRLKQMKTMLKGYELKGRYCHAPVYHFGYKK